MGTVSHSWRISERFCLSSAYDHLNLFYHLKGENTMITELNFAKLTPAAWAISKAVEV